MKVESNGRGLNVQVLEMELPMLKEVLRQYAELWPNEAPRWLWQLDAAIVAKQTDNRRQVTP